jgi:hypothetical protein
MIQKGRAIWENRTTSEFIFRINSNDDYSVFRLSIHNRLVHFLQLFGVVAHIVRAPVAPIATCTLASLREREPIDYTEAVDALYVDRYDVALHRYIEGAHAVPAATTVRMGKQEIS